MTKQHFEAFARELAMMEFLRDIPPAMDVIINVCYMYNYQFHETKFRNRVASLINRRQHDHHGVIYLAM